MAISRKLRLNWRRVAAASTKSNLRGACMRDDGVLAGCCRRRAIETDGQAPHGFICRFAFDGMPRLFHRVTGPPHDSRSSLHSGKFEAAFVSKTYPYVFLSKCAA